MTDNTNHRLDNMERSIVMLSEQVGNVARFMERLVVIEERNGFMSEQYRELKDALKESTAALSKKQELLETSVTNLKMELVKIVSVFSVITAVVAIAAPYVLKALLGGA